jgi:pimeloyl-ACP methyl ester carboxylesterase
MTLPSTSASEHWGDAGRINTRRVRMAWFEHGTSRIYYEVQGSGTPVLVLPGWFVGIEEFSGLRDALVVAGYRVIAADLPGSGRSEPLPRAYTTSSYKEDTYAVAALLQHLESEPTHLIGASSGGEICLLMAALVPEVARSVVTWGAAGVFSDPSGHLREAVSGVIDHPLPPLQQLRGYLVDTYGETNARAMTQSMGTAMSDIIKHSGSDISREVASNITCPVLLVAGSHDIFAPPALASELAVRIRAAEALVAEGAQHNVYMDRSEWLTHTILDWVGKH